MVNPRSFKRFVRTLPLGVIAAALPTAAQPVDGRVPPTPVRRTVPARQVKPDRTTAVAQPVVVHEASVRDASGFTTARRRLRDAMPTGRGVAFGHVEGSAGSYAPALEGPGYSGVALSYASGPSTPSGHATATARFIYGDKGLAPGVEVVHCLTAGDFMGDKVLRSNTPGAPPATSLGTHAAVSPRVYTHSWVGDPPEAAAARVLRRLDHVIDAQDVTVVAGVNNGRNSPVPSLLGSAHNVIAVGTTTGKHSGGYTRVAVPGRVKPDLIAPRGLTSYTTPVVAACAGLLIERADTLVAAGAAHAARSEVIKAALLGGCTRPESWAPEPGHWLDAWSGAGVLNIDRSLRILKEPALEPGGALRRRFGWSLATLSPGATARWDLALPATPGPVALTVVWHRRIDGRQAVLKSKATGETAPLWIDAPRTADFDLALVAVDDAGSASDVAVSASRVDNVELLVLEGLAKGAYRIELRRQAGDGEPDEAWDAVLTWAIDLPRRDAARGG